MTATTEQRALAGEIYDLIDLQGFMLWRQGSWFSTDSRISYCDEVLIDIWLDALENPSCGTTACVAGWAVIKTAPEGTKVSDFYVYYPDGTSMAAEEAGRIALGLDREQAGWLFSPERTRDDVLEALESLRDTGTFDVPYDDDYYDDYDDDYYYNDYGTDSDDE